MPFTARSVTRRRLLAISVAAFALAFGSAVAAPAVPPAAADVDDFSFDSWSLDYDVTLEDGQARLHATETITARFPDFDQNRGIVRGLPARYQDASTNVQVQSVTDGAGRDVPWELDEGYDEVRVLTGDDDYVQGAQTYVISYTMDDVVLAAQQTGLDEFYWDLLPTEREQTIRDVNARIAFDEQLTAALTGDVACYQGVFGSTATCSLDGPNRTPSAGAEFTLHDDELSPGEGITVAIGMQPGTVEQPDERITRGGDYVIDSWDADYRIGLDDERRTTMHATETISVTFPQSDIGHGISRVLDAQLMRAPTDVEVLSVSDENGAEVDWRVHDQGRSILVSTGADRYSDEGYLHGPHTFVIEYTMRDVILPPSDTSTSRVDRFSWTLLPRGREPVHDFSARISFDSELSAALLGGTCSGDCVMTGPKTSAEGAVFTVAPDLGESHQGVDRASTRDSPYASVRIEIEPDAVEQPLPRRQEPVMTVLPHVLAGSGFALGGGGIFAVLAMRRRARRTDHAVVAQYEVPRDLPPVVATVLGMGKNNVESAQIVHLAVNGVIRFTEAGGTDLTAELVEPLDSADAVELDQQTQRALFGTGEAGATRTFTEHDERFGERMRALREAGLAEAVSRGLLTRRRSRTALLLSIGALVLSLATMALAIVGLSLSMRGADVALASAIVAVVASVVAIIAFSIRYRVVTPDGALSAAHLEGVSLFIRVAEADRIEMLQSYAGAERLPDGEVDIVRVYEKLLPYAMLAGHADDWGRVLERAYATHEVSPDWAPYTTMNLVTTMRSVTSSVHASAATEPSSSSYSSSGGGSTGGGFSGGGGGGGSVGGW